MRLDKFISSSAGLTRTQAKKSIASGHVFVDSVCVKKPAIKVDESNEIVFLGKRLLLDGAIYIMLHKPLNTVCTTLDDDARSVMGLLTTDLCDALHIAGRLDVDTTGLVLLTNDGDWSHRVTSPKKKCGKRYRVALIDIVPEHAVEQFLHGIQLKGEKNLTRPAELAILSSHEVLLTIHEGKYHQVKRMFASINNRVVGLHREQVGRIALDEGLKAGEWRFLTEAEVSSV